MVANSPVQPVIVTFYHNQATNISRWRQGPAHDIFFFDIPCTVTVELFGNDSVEAVIHEADKNNLPGVIPIYSYSK